MFDLRPGSDTAPPFVPAPSASSLLAARTTGTDVERVYSQIFDAVMDRRLLPGAKLTEATLCSLFDCSRASVRGALAQLAHDKIVDIQPNRGAFVRQPDAKETQDVFEMRRAAECLVVDKLLALPDTRKRLVPLYAMVRQEQKYFEEGDRISWIRLSNAFHVKLAQVADNHILTEWMHGLCSRTTLIIAYYDTPDEKTCSYTEHRDILDALAAGNRESAMRAMMHHLQDCEQRVRDAQPTTPDPWMAFSVKRQEAV